MQLFTDKIRWWHIETINKAKLSLEAIWCIERWIHEDEVENKWTKKLREMHWIKDNKLQQIAKDTYYAIRDMEEPIAKKKMVKQAVIPTQYDEQWKELWDMWPTMRSFTWKGKKFTCNKPFKSNEQKLKLKYIAAIENGICPELINKAAKTALAWCMENSYRKGRNEMEYMNGLEPWINQGQWRNWSHIEMPPMEEEKVYNNVTDM